MPIYKTKVFARFARKESIADQDLCRAAAEVAEGNHDADLGGGVYKQRVARPGAGKSGGFRTILLFQEGAHVFFVYGFAKSARANVGPDELRAFRKLASEMLAYTVEEIEKAVEAGELIKVPYDGEADENYAQVPE
jgi:hypothetical protein